MQQLGQEVTVFPDAEEFIQQWLHQDHMRETAAAIRRDPVNHPLRKTLLKVPLLPYQLDGIAFAAGAGRAVLADDMGLGQNDPGRRRGGVAGPRGRHPQGARRLPGVAQIAMAERNPPLLRPRRAAGRRPHGRAGRAIRQRLLLHRLQLRAGAARHPGDRAGQMGPDHSRRRAADQELGSEDRRHVIKSLRSRFALVLSGTPLENRLDELYSVVQFIDDRRLGPGFRFFNKHRVVDEKGKVLGYKNLGELRETLKPILLRRTRDSVALELPPRTMEIVRIAPDRRAAGAASHAHADRRLDRAQEVHQRDGPAAAAKGAA